MFDPLVEAMTSRGVATVGAWARVENAACARRLFATAEELQRMWAADGSAEREQWCLDNWGAVAASVAAAQSVSLGVASHQLLVADSLRHRLPRVAEVFAAGAISYRLICAIVNRTRLIDDPHAMAKVDTDIAAHAIGWASLSAEKIERQIDSWVHRYDPAAVRRTEERTRDCHVDVRDPEDGSGTVWVEGRLIITDGQALDQRLDAIARTVCDKDPRTHAQRRAAALGVFGHGADRLACQCEDPDCDAADSQPSTVVVHVIAHEESLTDDTPVQLDGEEPVDPDRKPWQEMTWRELLAPRPPEPEVIAATEAPRDVRRLHFLGRMESCQRIRRGGIRRSCVSGRCGWSPRSAISTSRSGRRWARWPGCSGSARPRRCASGCARLRSTPAHGRGPRPKSPLS